MKRQKFTKEQEKFIKKFIDMLYHNMAIENEAPYSKREFYEVYRHHAIDLIKDGSYKNIKY